MEQDFNFRILQVQDNNIQFIAEKITITVDRFSYVDGKHEINSPQTANAQFVCCGSKYIVENTDGVATVEEWYTEELLPKMQMLSLLLGNTPV
ncbi:MAG: hypothetical protein JWQ38_1794 [Flavipsychrobacter sp.]|nr:hypothetical protein [Flavipsychrobacter sp.]